MREREAGRTLLLPLGETEGEAPTLKLLLLLGVPEGVAEAEGVRLGLGIGGSPATDTPMVIRKGLSARSSRVLL